MAKKKKAKKRATKKTAKKVTKKQASKQSTKKVASKPVSKKPAASPSLQKNAESDSVVKQSGGSEGSPRGGGNRLGEADLLTIKVIEKWKQTAAVEVDTIGGWRDADPGDRLYEYWARTDSDGGTMPNQFYSDTTYLLGWVVSNHPKLDPTPLQDVYDAVSAWHGDHNAERVPEQRVLMATLDRAMQVVQAVEMVVLNNSSPPADDWQDKSPTLEERISSRHGILESLLPMEPPDSGFDETTDLRATSDELWLALRRFRRGLIEGGSFPPVHWFHQLCDIGQKAHEMGLRPHWGSEQYIAASPTSLRKTDPTGGWEDIPSEMVVVLIGAGESCFLETCYLCDGFINPQQRREAILWSEGWMRARERMILSEAQSAIPQETGPDEGDNGAQITNRTGGRRLIYSGKRTKMAGLFPLPSSTRFVSEPE